MLLNPRASLEAKNELLVRLSMRQQQPYGQPESTDMVDQYDPLISQLSTHQR